MKEGNSVYYTASKLEKITAATNYKQLIASFNDARASNVFRASLQIIDVRANA